MKKSINWDLELCKKYAKKRGYELLSKKYKNARTKMKFRHLKCGTISNIVWDKFSNSNHGCHKCAKNKKLTIGYCKRVAKKNGYLINDEFYVNCSEPLSFTHLACGRTYDATWTNFNSGKRCPSCYGTEKLTIKFCKEEAEKEGFLILSKEYKTAKLKLKFYHLDCKREFDMSWDKFISRKRCSVCSRDSIESSIAIELKLYYEKKYNSISEYKIFKNPKTERFLPYDIFIPKGKVSYKDVFIEVNGKQHYSFVSSWHKDLETFEYSKKKDKFKKKYANKNGIFIEIDLRKIKTPEKAISHISNILDKENRVGK